MMFCHIRFLKIQLSNDLNVVLGLYNNILYHLIWMEYDKVKSHQMSWLWHSTLWRHSEHYGNINSSIVMSHWIPTTMTATTVTSQWILKEKRCPIYLIATQRHKQDASQLWNNLLTKNRCCLLCFIFLCILLKSSFLTLSLRGNNRGSQISNNMNYYYLAGRSLGNNIRFEGVNAL